MPVSAAVPIVHPLEMGEGRVDLIVPYRQQRKKRKAKTAGTSGAKSDAGLRTFVLLRDAEVAEVRWSRGPSLSSSRV
jgi:hypothetical protein